MPVEEFPAFISLKENRSVENVEMGFKKEKGEITWLSVTSAPVPLEKYGVAITYGDITEIKKSESSLRESEKTLKTILKAAPAGIGFTCNRVMKRVNDKLVQMTGYSEEELIGKSARILYENDREFERVGTVKYEQIRKTGTGSIETQWKHRNGNLIDIHLSSIAINKGDLLEGVIFTALDITEIKKGEKLLRESKERYSSLSFYR
jgi:PAS domain S-box-containing protein